ncbi:AfsR/SARP family transcriptional regulator [Actinomadura alba]|uniref:Tetratricopeptide repeat protein n=1 Tax=Actinomadura alba TaxID=406431 RepID=A0ABR7LVH6_9ACTN|nr:tetratricopeptide repeat protein [Actinomadura alba]MBC6468774.1 tetratricopeptide repeat protein [Actinomadura alba]
MEFRILGPVELWADGRRLELGSAKERQTLAILLLAPGRPVPTEALIGRLWAGNPPPKPRDSLYAYIARLRGRLNALEDGRARLRSGSGAYSLEVDPDTVDLHQFRRLCDQAQAVAESGDAEHALELLREADQLWRGEALIGMDGDWAAEIRTGLESERRAATQRRIAVRLDLGHHAELVAELYGLIAQHPLDEEFVKYLMVALYRCGRQADALAAYRQARLRLDMELGMEPGPALQEAHQRILRGDADLAAPPSRGNIVQRESPNDLPRDIPNFTGRAAEMERLVNSLENGSFGNAGPIEVIDGMPGVGKTALAVHVAHQLADRYPDGQLFLRLRGHDPNHEPLDPRDGLGGLLRLLGVARNRIPASLEGRAALWRSELADRRAIIILDDAADQDQIRPFLPGTSGCLVLVTSRRRLTDLEGVNSVSLDVFPAEDAAALFRQAAGEDRAMGADDVGSVVRLCGRLPLAIQLVANQLRHRPARNVADLATRLSRARLQLAEIRAGDRDVAAAFELSYRGLTDEVRQAFRRLGLHPGIDLTVQSAAALIGCTPDTCERILEELLDHHLIEEAVAGRVRFHDLLRKYAAERALAEEPEHEAREAVHRLLDHYLYIADKADRVMYAHLRRTQVDIVHVPDAPPLLESVQEAQEWLKAERVNLVASAQYAADHQWPSHAWQLPQVLATFLERFGYWDDAVVTHEKALVVCRTTGMRECEAKALLELSLVRGHTGHFDLALSYSNDALAIYRSIGDHVGEAETLDQQARVCWYSGRFKAALSHAEAALEIFRSVGNPHGECQALIHKGVALWQAGMYLEAVTDFEEVITLNRDIGDRRVQAQVQNNIGEIALRLGDGRRAMRMFHDALVAIQDIGWAQSEGVVLNNIGNAHQSLDEPDEALRFYREALKIYQATGDRRNTANVLNNIGATYVRDQRYAEGLIHHQKALGIAQVIADPFEESRALRGIGEVHRGSGQYSAALGHFRRALTLARDLADPYEEACCLEGLGDATLRIQGHDAAEPLWSEALAIFDRLNVPEGEALRAQLHDLGLSVS